MHPEYQSLLSAEFYIFTNFCWFLASLAFETVDRTLTKQVKLILAIRTKARSLKISSGYQKGGFLVNISILILNNNIKMM